MPQFIKDPNMTSDELTLLTSGGNFTVNRLGDRKATDEEYERINAMMPLLPNDMGLTRVVRNLDGELFAVVDFEFIYDGSDELQESDEDNLKELKVFYSGYKYGPDRFDRDTIQSFICSRYIGLHDRCLALEGVDVAFVANGSFFEARIYFTESALKNTQTMDIVRASVYDIQGKVTPQDDPKPYGTFYGGPVAGRHAYFGENRQIVVLHGQFEEALPESLEADQLIEMMDWAELAEYFPDGARSA